MLFDEAKVHSFKQRLHDPSCRCHKHVDDETIQTSDYEARYVEYGVWSPSHKR